MLRKTLLCVPAVLLMGCAALFLQTDDFQEKLNKGCSTLEHCRQLWVDARARVAQCEPNTVGYVRCGDAEADLIRAEGFLRAVEERLQARQLAQEAEGRRAEEKARLAAEAKLYEQRKAEQTRIEAERLREMAQRDAERERDEELRRREQEQVLAEREHQLAELAQAEAAELEYLRALTPGLRRKKLEACYAQTSGCDPLAIRLVGVAATDAERTSLATLNERLKTPPAPSQSRTTKSGGSSSGSSSGGGNRIQCCDGTLSPSCTCDRASLRGCCSHHGGVCGCAE